MKNIQINFLFKDEDRKISYLLDLVDELAKSTGDDTLKSSQDSSQTPGYLTPTPPRRHRVFFQH